MKKTKTNETQKLMLTAEKVRDLTPIADDKLRGVVGGDDGVGGGGPTHRRPSGI